MKNKLFLLGLILISSIAMGQNYNFDYVTREALDFYRSNKMMSGEWNSGTLTEKNIEGSPYLTNEFIDGSIFTIQKEKYVDIPVRYNIYNDQLEFKNADGEIQALANPEIVEKVEFGDYKMDYLPYTYSKKIRRGFFIILVEGKASLYTKKNINFKEAEQPGAYKEAEPPKFVKGPDEYFIRVGLEEAKLVGSKNDLMDIFPDHKNEIEQFIKKNKVKTNKPESLKELVDYYNTL